MRWNGGTILFVVQNLILSDRFTRNQVLENYLIGGAVKFDLLDPMNKFFTALTKTKV